MGWPTPASSSELEPARLGLPASLEVEEDGTELGQGTAGAEVVHQRRSRARRQWRRGGVAEKGGFMREGLSWGLYRFGVLAGKATWPGIVQNRGWRSRPVRWRSWTAGRALWWLDEVSGTRVGEGRGQWGVPSGTRVLWVHLAAHTPWTRSTSGVRWQ